MRNTLHNISPPVLYYAAWFIALVATLGSLFFSEVLGYPPCVLCWYQRILMYPNVILLAIGFLRKDRGLPFYVLPLVTAGSAIAVFHNLLYWGVFKESASLCAQGVSCTSTYIAWFGFITIPLLSLTAFICIDLLMVAALLVQRKQRAHA